MNRSLQQSGKKIDFTHYYRLLLDKKIWVLTILVIFSAGWLLYIPKFLNASKKYEFSATIRFDDPRVRSRIGNFDERSTRMETESQTKIILTTPFLTEVIDSLKLNVLSQTPRVSRSEIFEDIQLDKQVKYGKYLLKLDKSNIKLLYTNKKEEKKNFLLAAQPLKGDSAAVFNENGLHLKVKKKIFSKHDEIKFACISTPFLVASLRSKLHLVLNRRQTLFRMVLIFNDPFLGAKIMNMIADLFLQKSLESKRFRTRNLLKSLTEQLKTSKQELEKADNELRRFREKNPHIYLTGDMAAYNQQMTAETMERDQIRKNIERLNGLLHEVGTAENTNDSDLIFQEVLSFLQEQRIPGITAISQQYQNALTQKQSLVAQNYAKDNPRMKEINSSLSALKKKIKERASEFLTEQNSRYNELARNMNVSEQRLRQSPRKEIELARLQRNREAKAQIYSNLLVRYSEVKVADVSITPDAEILQYAEVPIMLPNFKEKLIKYGLYLLGPLLGLILGAGLFIGYDFVRHRARSEKDLENIIKIPVLSTIPLIDTEKEIPEDFDSGRRMDPKLITIDFVPSPASEAFRKLRTRLVLDETKDQALSLIFTSLMPNEGKSLVVSNLAITFAQLKKPTLLIDGDIRRGVLHNSFAINKSPGLSDLLALPHDLTVETVSNSIHKTTIPNLHLMPSGKEIPNPTEVIMAPRMEELFKQLQKRFHYIIIDTPPVGLIPDAFVFNKFIHSLVLVTRYGQTDVKKLKKEINQFSEMQTDVKGVVLNGMKESSKKERYGYSYYKY